MINSVSHSPDDITNLINLNQTKLQQGDLDREYSTYLTLAELKLSLEPSVAAEDWLGGPMPQLLMNVSLSADRAGILPRLEPPKFKFPKSELPGTAGPPTGVGRPEQRGSLGNNLTVTVKFEPVGVEDEVEDDPGCCPNCCCQ